MRLLIGTSTKMNMTSTEAADYLRRLRAETAAIVGVDLFVLPPFTSIWVAQKVMAGSNVAWGAQDVHPEDDGAHTGDISARMLVDLGCRYVECGHSERRRAYGESDDLVAAKVAQVVRYGMTPIVCIGEPTLGPVADAIRHVEDQLSSGLAMVSNRDLDTVVVAYEPVWAIGAGAGPADPVRVEAVHLAIRSRLDELGGHAGTGRIVYGGSVDPSNVGSLLDRPGVDGLFVGRSALDPSNFTAIALTAADVACHRSQAPGSSHAMWK